MRALKIAAPSGPRLLGDALAVHNRVLFIIDRLEALGGAERALLEMTRHLPAAGYQCAIVTFSNGIGANIVNLFECPVHVLPMKRTYDVSGFLCALALRRIVRTFKPDVVHTFFETSDSWGSLVSRLCGVRAIVSSRRDMGILRTAKHDVLYKVLRRNFDVVLAVSNAVRSFCIKADGIAPERVLTVYNGVAEPELSPNARAVIRARHGLPPDAPVVVMVGNVRRIKGINTFLETAALVHAHASNAAFLVVGAIRESDYFQELTTSPLFREMAGRFIFAGPSQEVGTYLQGSDVFCMLSRSEGFSNALLEAMACGLTAVVTDVGGNSEAMINGEHGFLVPVGDSATAAKYILNLLADDSLNDRLGTNAQRRVRSHFNTETMIRQLSEIYAAIIRQHAPRRSEASAASPTLHDRSPE